MPPPLLQLTSISKAFGGVPALKGVSFELQAGEVHALLGENGAGKSTLVKIITGAHRPDAGTIEIAGESFSHLTPARAHQQGIASIYQQPALFPDLTVEENLGLRLEPGSPLRRIDWKKRRQRAATLLERIGAHVKPDAGIRSLSMPEQQLVEIACAVGAGARVMIMDEPTSALTRSEQKLLFVVVEELRSRGVGILYISHRLEEIFALADRVTVLRDGECIGTRRVRPRKSASPDSDNEEPPLTESALIRMMIGRELARLFPTADSQPGAVQLSLDRVGCAGSGLHDISLTVQSGEIVGLAGLVGAGRTELAQVLFGITPADTGEIRIQDRVVSIRHPAEAIELGIAYVPEDRRRHGAILEMPVAHNVTLATHPRLFPWGWLNRSREDTVTRRWIQDLQIRTTGPGAITRDLSGGNQQKVALARWLETAPRILILDEPTQGIDVGAKSEIHHLIRQLAGRGLAVLMISSDLTEILGMSDRIAVMRGGTVVTCLPGQSSPDEVMAAALGLQPDAGI